MYDKKVGVSAKISIPLSDAIEDFRWENRVKNRQSIVIAALEEFFESRGIAVEYDDDKDVVFVKSLSANTRQDSPGLISYE